MKILKSRLESLIKEEIENFKAVTEEPLRKISDSELRLAAENDFNQVISTLTAQGWGFEKIASVFRGVLQTRRAEERADAKVRSATSDADTTGTQG